MKALSLKDPLLMLPTRTSCHSACMSRQLIDTVKGDSIGARPGYYPQRNQIVRARFDQLEQEFAAEVPDTWRRYVAAGDPGMLNQFTERCVERVVSELQ